MEIDDNILQPNNGAYEKGEMRVGLPLSYIAEKLRGALASAHQVYRIINHSAQIARPDLTNSQLACQEPVASACVSFKYSLTAFLAMYNMLGMIADPNKVDSLLNCDQDEFAVWLNTVEREGSILG